MAKRPHFGFDRRWETHAMTAPVGFVTFKSETGVPNFCNRVTALSGAGSAANGAKVDHAGVRVGLVGEGQESPRTEPKTQEECRCVNLQGAQRRAGGA